MKFWSIPKLSLKRLLLAITTWSTSQVTTALLFILITLSTVVFVESTRSWLIKSALSFVSETTFFSDNKLRVTFSGIESSSVNHISIKEFTVLRDEKPWIQGKDFDLLITLKYLWLNNIHIHNLSIKELSYNHQGPLSLTDEQPNTNKTPSPIKIPDIHLQSFAIKKLSLTNVLPNSLTTNLSIHEELTYYISGDGKKERNKPLSLLLNAKSLKAQLPSLKIRAEQANINEIDAFIEINETAGGSLGNYLHLPGTRPLVAKANVNFKQHNQQALIRLENLTLPIVDYSVIAKGDLMFQPALQSANTKHSRNWQLIVNEGLIEIDQNRSTLIAELTPEALFADINLNQIPVGMLKPWLPKVGNGHVSGVLSASGPYSEISMNGELQSDMQYDNKRLSIQTKAEFNKGLITLDRFNINYDKATLQSNGLVDLKGNNNNLSFNLANITTHHIQSFDIQIPDELTGGVHTATGKLSGRLKSPLVHFDAVGSGHYNDMPVDFNASLYSKDNTVYLVETKVSLPKGHAVARGQFNWNTQVTDLKVSIKELPLEFIELFEAKLPDNTSGSISSEIYVQGPLKQLNYKTESVLSGNYESTSLLLHSQINRTGDRIDIERIQADVNAQQTVAAHGYIDGAKLDLDIQVDNFPSDLSQLVSIPLPDGLISSKLMASGTLNSPEIHGNITYSLIGFEDAESNSIPITLQTDLETENGDLIITGRANHPDTTSSNVELTLAIKPYVEYFLQKNQKTSAPLPFNFNLKSNLDTSWLSYFIDSDLQQINGKITTDLNISGDLDHPILNGYASLQNFDYFNSLSGTNIVDVNCRIKSLVHTITVEKCLATDGDKGKFEVMGGITLPNKNPGNIDLSFNLKQANIISRSDINSQTSGTVKLTGDFKTAVASGQLEVSPLEAIIDINVGSTPPEIEYTEVNALDEQTLDQNHGSFQPPLIVYDIDISVANQAYLRGRGLDAELGGQFQLTGNSNDPNFAGDLSIIRGELELFGRKFELSQGQMIIIDGSTSLSATGIYDKLDKQITAKIEGTNNALSINFSSVPALPEDEILSYIIFGESASNIEPIKAIQLALAIQKLKGGQSSLDLMGSARDILDVDSITLDNYTSEENGESGLSVGVGKYLNEKTYLEIERTPNPSQPWKGTINIEVTPRVLIQSTTGGSSGIDSAEIIWQKDY